MWSTAPEWTAWSQIISIQSTVRHCACSTLDSRIYLLHQWDMIWKHTCAHTHTHTHTHVQFYNNLSHFSRQARSLGEWMHIDLTANYLHQRAIRATHYFLYVSLSFFPPLRTAEPWVRDPLCEWHTRAVLTRAVIHSAVCLQHCCCMRLHIAQVTKDGGLRQR